MYQTQIDHSILHGKIRLILQRDHKRWTATYMVLDPQSDRPYTYGRLAEDLALCQQEYPQLANSANPLLTDIRQTAVSRPDAVFSLSGHGAYKEAAVESLNKTSFYQLLPMIVFLSYFMFDRALVSGDLLVKDFVYFQRAGLYINMPLIARTRLLSCLDLFILPVAGSYSLKELNESGHVQVMIGLRQALGLRCKSNSLCITVMRAYRDLINAIRSAGGAVMPVYNDSLVFEARKMPDPRRSRPSHLIDD
ncbi:hypothetical protein H6B33_06100 [Gemmiger formicilis]|uniref:hypothetical protein n=1 Tax=Gemmiger formicilis TaxID=745368 RepID=UPI00195AC224|nr:hypothetical protein [Gemmiger formicilis]MBM6914976.1 hypothetical protein [Gemmiger formicilis]